MGGQDGTIKIQVSGLNHGSDNEAYVRVCRGTSAATTKIPLEITPTSSEYLLPSLSWYLEEYINQPFEIARSSQTSGNIKSYAAVLIALILENISNPSSLQGSRLILEVLDPLIEATSPDILHQGPDLVSLLHWECLEDVILWPWQFKPQAIAVVRMTSALVRDQGELQLQPKEMDRGLRVLALSARPAGERDIPHRLISRTILRVADGLKHKPNSPELVIARPGSLSGLQNYLSAYGKGHFDIVHLDVHGIANEEKAILCFTNDSDPTQVDQVIARNLAEILRTYEVPCVIINACQSASGINNFTRSLVEHGISTALGMQYNLLESAAEIFTAALYKDILSRRRPILDACSYARSALRIFSRRKTDYNTTIAVSDYLNPVLYTSEYFTTLEPRTPDDLAIGAVGTDVDETLLGRESTILDLENDLSTFSNRIYLLGSPGAGKSTLARHLSTWWKATGFVQRTILIDFATFKPASWTEVCHSICHQLGLQLDDGKELRQVLIQTRHLIIFDSLDVVDDTTSANIWEGMSKFSKSIKRTKRYKNPSGILYIGRQEVNWIRSFTGSTYHLNGIDLSSGMKMCFNLLERLSRPLHVTDLTTARYMEQIVALVDGNPLALELLMADFSARGENLSQYFFRLTSNRPFSLDNIKTLNLHDNRSLNEALCLRSTSWNHELLTNIRYLSPFWKFIPVQLSSYWKFLKLSSDRVSETPAPLRIGDLRARKKAAESMDEIEKKILFYKEAYRGDFDHSELDDINVVFCSLLNALCKSGYFSKPVTGTFGESSEEDYFIIHPILTLCLRTSADVDTIDTDGLVIPVAYHRFYCRRDKQWPDAAQWSPEWIAPGKQIEFEFENYVTYLNFMFTIEPTQWTMVSLEPKVVFHLGRRHPRTVIIALGIMNRGLQQYLKYFRMKRPTKRSRLAGGTVKLAAIAYVKLLKGMQASTEGIEDPFRLVYVAIGVYCCVLTLSATMTSIDLGFETTKYREIMNELSNGYIDGVMFSDAFKGMLTSLRHVFYNVDNNNKDWSVAWESVGKVTGTDLLSVMYGEHQEENRKAIRAITGRKEWEYNIDIMRETSLEYFNSSTVSEEEILALESQLHQVLLDNMRDIQSPGIPVHMYNNLVLLAMRRGEFLLALQHCKSTLLHLSELPMEEPWTEARRFCNNHLQKIMSLLGNEGNQ
ncbi:hypothetical protein VTL71DRAFT_9541 [Oculimacula yallundae]|uniref:CHAT domain-containing protein n=1 Tax=Oculimacula yallundae TaxID=86028 RepID=A0ABR4BSC2_9HELO